MLQIEYSAIFPLAYSSLILNYLDSKCIESLPIKHKMLLKSHYEDLEEAIMISGNGNFKNNFQI